MITYTNDSMLDNLSDHSVVLLQVGTKGWIGSGVTRQVFNKWKEAFADYFNLCCWFKDGHDEELMGSWARTRIDKGLIILNAIVQRTVGKTKQIVDYDSWEKVCRKLERLTKYVNKKTGEDWKIHTFAKIGMSAETDPDLLNEIFKTYFEDSPVELVIHAY